MEGQAGSLPRPRRGPSETASFLFGHASPVCVCYPQAK
uniref:Uncharacterized protein n=1 Tax=Anguilla anguilla TaxID=7936 RepID=A0A0E9V812_ANGAN